MRNATLCLALLLLLTPAGLAAAQDLTELELFLTYIPNVQFAPVYVALEHGYFAAAGFDLRIRHGAEHDGVDLVAANQLQLGIFGGEQVLLARAQGRPVVTVYEWFQRFPAGVAVASAAPASLPQGMADLAGQRVGIHGRSGVSWSAFVALMHAAQLTEQDFTLENVGFNVPELICLGRIDAAVVYLNNEPLQIRDRIRAGDCGDVNALQVFPVTDVADLVSNGLVSNETTIEQQPQRLAAFVAAFDLGLRAAIANPAAAMLASAQYVEGLVSPADQPWLQQQAMARAELLATGAGESALAADLVAMRTALADRLTAATLLQLDVLLATIPLWQAEVPGFSERAAWHTTADVLQAAGMLEAAPDVDQAFTNRFLPDMGGGGEL